MGNAFRFSIADMPPAPRRSRVGNVCPGKLRWIGQYKGPIERFGTTEMRFSWTGLLLAPLLVPVLLGAALPGLLGGNSPVVGFLIMLVPGCIISYGAMVCLFLPSLFLLSVFRTPTGFMVCLLGAVLGAVADVPVTFVAWGSSGHDSGPPTEGFFTFFLRWSLDPVSAAFPLAGLLTAGTYWWLGTRHAPRGGVVR
jgi:hypothetical protein